MPETRTVYRWLLDEKHETFCRSYARARELQAEHLFEEMQEIADDGRNDWMERNGFPMVNGEAIQRSKLRLEDRKWRAGKLKPKVYGDAGPQVVNNIQHNTLVCDEATRARIIEQRKRLLGGKPDAILEAEEAPQAAE
jgi:hypothetical protein